MKAVIDTGTMITLSGTCLMNVFRNFIKENNIELLISSTVAEESVWKPLTNKRFALNAARIKYAINEKIVKLIPTNKETQILQQKILNTANACFSSNEGNLEIIQAGEAEALALIKIHQARALFIDERTTRALIENPTRLKQILERRQDKKITMNSKNIELIKQMFGGLLMFRSIDIVATSYEQNLFDHELGHGKLELEAALYATKFNGCAVSEKEIKEYLEKK